MDAVAHQHAAERRGAVGHALGEADHVGDDAVALGGKGVAEPAEAGDHLVEDQQDAVRSGDIVQALKVAFGLANTPAEPSIGSTMTAAIEPAPSSATMQDSPSARSSPSSGSPLV